MGERGDGEGGGQVIFLAPDGGRVYEQAAPGVRLSELQDAG